MASHNAVQATLTGELSALGSNKPEFDTSSQNDGRYLEAVTPQLVEQVNLEAAALTGWLQFKTKNYLIREIFANSEQGEPTEENEEVPLVDPIDSLLSGEFAINLVTVRDEAVIPELQQQRKAHLESAADIVASQIPRLRKRHEKAVSSSRLKDAADLQKDIDNCQMRMSIHKGMLSYIKRLAADTDPQGELMDTVDKVAHDAKLDVFREIIELLAERSVGLDEDSEEFMVIQRKVLALEAERQAMLAVQSSLEMHSEVEADLTSLEVNELADAFNQPTSTVYEFQPVPEQKRALVRVMGSLSVGGGIARRMFLR